MMEEDDEINQSMNGPGSFYGNTCEKLNDLINKSNQYSINTQRFMAESKSGLLQTARTASVLSKNGKDEGFVQANMMNMSYGEPSDQRSLVSGNPRASLRTANYASENKAPKSQARLTEYRSSEKEKELKRGHSEDKPCRRGPVIGFPAARLKNLQFSMNFEAQGLNSMPKRALSEKERLQILNMNSNAFKFFPVEIAQLRHLRVLLLENNYIRKIPSETFYSLPYLETLSLKNNLLQELPASIVNLSSSLANLNVSHNHLEKIEDFIGYLEKLRILHINSNDFFQLPVKLKFLKKTLQELKLEWFRYLIPEGSVTQSGGLLDDFFTFLALERKEAVVNFHEFLEYVIKDFNFNRLDANCNSLLHFAVIHEDHGVIKNLLKIKCEHIDRANTEGETPLSIAIREDKFFAAKILLYNGVSINLKTGIMGSYLNLASAKLQIYIVQDLLGLGADVNQRDMNGNSALHYIMSVFSRDSLNAEKICDLLLDAGADPNATNNEHWAPVHIAVKRGQKEALEYIFSYNDKVARGEKHKIKINTLNASDKKTAKISFNLDKKGGCSKWSIIHLAAFFNFTEILQKLIEKGVDVFSKNIQGYYAKDIIPKNNSLRKIIISSEKRTIRRVVISKLREETRKKNSFDLAASLDDEEIDENEESKANNLEQNFNRLSEINHTKNRFGNAAQVSNETKPETQDTSDCDSAEVDDENSVVLQGEDMLEEFEESSIKPLNMKCGSNNIRNKDKLHRICDKLKVFDDKRGKKVDMDERARQTMDSITGLLPKINPGITLEFFIEQVKKLIYFMNNLTSSLKKLETNFLKRTELIKEVTLIYENKQERVSQALKYQKSLAEKAFSLFILSNLISKFEAIFNEVRKEQKIILKLKEMEKKGTDSRFKKEFKENCRLSIEEIVASLEPEREVAIYDSVCDLSMNMATCAGDSVIKARMLPLFCKKSISVKAENFLQKTINDVSASAEFRYEAFQNLVFAKRLKDPVIVEHQSQQRSLSSARYASNSNFENNSIPLHQNQNKIVPYFGKRSNSVSRSETASSSGSFLAKPGDGRVPVAPKKK